MLDIRKGVIVSRTNLIDSKKEMMIPWKGITLIIFITASIWGAAFYYSNINQKKIINLQSNLNNLKQGRDYQKIALVSDSESRLDKINSIMTERIDWEKLFQKIEENTIPDVTFSGMDMKVVDPNGANDPLGMSGTKTSEYRMDLKGTTIGLNNLAKQILAFEGNKDDKTAPLASDVRIQKIDIKKTDSGGVDKGGALDFSIRVDVNPNIIKTDFSSSNK